MKEMLEKRAVARCVDEMARAQLYLRAYSGLCRAESYHGVDFIRLACWALFDQMIAHTIKVLDPREKAGLWFLVKEREDRVQELCEQHEISLEHLRSVRKGFQTIRDKTHFHLDQEGVKNSKGVWRQADISWGGLEAAIDNGLRLLCLLHKEIRGTEYRPPYYDGSDATKIAEHAYNHGLLSTGEPVSPTLAALYEQ